VSPKVEQQMKVHIFVNAFTNFDNAMRSRLLRLPTFASEMEEALSDLRNTIEASSSGRRRSLQDRDRGCGGQ
jgi:hypothetical protein